MVIGRRAFIGGLMGLIAGLKEGVARVTLPEGMKPAADLARALASALTAYRTRDLATGDALSLALRDPLAQRLAEWAALRLHGDVVGFERIATFLSQNRDMSGTVLIRRKGEDALYREARADDDIRSFFNGQAPMTPTGRFLLARALAAQGRVKEMAQLIRKSWREDVFPSDIENELLSRFGDSLEESDHRARTEKLIAEENWGAALRSAEKAGGETLALAKIRIAIGKRDPDAAKLLASAPPSLRNDPGFILSEAQFHRRADRLDEAYAALSRFSKEQTPPRPDDWWTERRVLARRLAEQKKLEPVLDLLKIRPGMTPSAIADALFMAGLFALDIGGDAVRAEQFFRESEQKASLELGRARAAYWVAVARQAQSLDARDALMRAARLPFGYYGQLAREALQQGTVSFKPTPEADFTRAASEPAFQAVIMLLEAGDGELASLFANDLSQKYPDAATLSALAALGHSYKDIRLVTLTGRASMQRGFSFDFENWPVDDFPLPDKPPVEPALIYAITRQESAFDPNAISSAGARGFMQLMVATAQDTAKKANVNFSAEKLTSDPAFNVLIGSTHLAELLEDWGGSYCLAIASYNAGKGNVRKWIAANGDPRETNIDPVRWVEKIPVTETRIYVQRVMENLQIYRARLEGKSDTTLNKDLRRGA